MRIKDNNDAIFHHYILDYGRRQRELKYTIGMIILTAAFFFWVQCVYQNPPLEAFGSVPTIVFTIIISQAAYYFLYTCYIGSKVLDVECDRKEGLLESTAEGKL